MRLAYIGQAMWFRSALLSVLAAAGVMSAQAHAAPLADATARAALFTPVQYRDRGGSDVRPLREIVSELRAQYGGELISARLEQGGQPVYVIRWRMPDGQVRDFRVSASR